MILYAHLREVMCTVAHLSLGSYRTIKVIFRSKFSQLGNRIIKKLLYFFYDTTTVRTVYSVQFTIEIKCFEIFSYLSFFHG